MLLPWSFRMHEQSFPSSLFVSMGLLTALTVSTPRDWLGGVQRRWTMTKGDD